MTTDTKQIEPTGSAYFIFSDAFWKPDPETKRVPFCERYDPLADKFRWYLIGTSLIHATSVIDVLINTFTLRVDYRAPLTVHDVVDAVDRTMAWAGTQADLFPGHSSQPPTAFIKRVRPIQASELTLANGQPPTWRPFVVVLPPRE